MINQYSIPHRVRVIKPPQNSSEGRIMIFNQVRREFVAKMIVDIGKTIFAVGLASYFFEKFSSGAKIILWCGCVLLLILSIFIQPKQK